jgi:hypothetical protein
MNRRSFLKTVAAAAVLPVAGSSPATTWAVNRRNMWPHDPTSEETLLRCNRLLAVNENDTLALVHRGSIPVIYFDQMQAWADLSRAISLEPLNPCCWYIRGTCFDRADDLRHAISLFSKGGDIIGSDDGELMFMAQRELKSVLEDEACK